MMLLRKCVSCKSYCIHEKCPVCGGSTSCGHPVKFRFLYASRKE